MRISRMKMRFRPLSRMQVYSHGADCTVLVLQTLYSGYVCGRRTTASGSTLGIGPREAVLTMKRLDEGFQHSPLLSTTLRQIRNQIRGTPLSSPVRSKRRQNPARIDKLKEMRFLSPRLEFTSLNVVHDPVRTLLLLAAKRVERFTLEQGPWYRQG
jgi:hypothetical protein